MSNKLQDPKLSFSLTSSVGHEQILTCTDLEAMLRSCYYNSKTVYNKVKPFFDVCIHDFKQNGTLPKDNSSL